MASDGGGGNSGWWEAATLAFLTISGLFGFTHKRIGTVRAELHEDQADETKRLRLELGRMEKMFEDRFQEGRIDRGEMWRTIEELQRRQAEQHAQTLEALNKIPTRDEMMQLLLQSLRGPNARY